MRSQVILLALFALCCGSLAQNTSMNEDTGNFYSEKLIQINSDVAIKFIVKEVYAPEFHKDPVGFSKFNFNMKAYIKNSKKREYHGYKVSFKSNNGYLLEEYDSNGKLLYNFRQFKNKRLPFAVQQEVTENFKNWRILNKEYIASGQRDKIDEEVYNIKINNGKESKILRIIPDKNSPRAIVNN